MILNSVAFDKMLDEFGSEERISVYAKETPLIARQLANNASPLGCLRLISLQNQLQLKFEGLTFSKFVGTNNLQIDVPKMIREVLNNSQKHHFDEAELAAQVAAEQEKGFDCWQISCGHDIVGILSIAFRKTFGGKNTGDVATETIERSLRLAYDAAHLRETKLYRAIVDWEDAQPGFAILNRTQFSDMTT